MKPRLAPLLVLLFLARLYAADPAPAHDGVLYFEKARLDEAFAKGGSLVQTPGYRMSTSRRVGPGTVEIHERDTDIFYVVDGTATFVTGGTAVEPKPSGPNEIRAASINGGATRQLGKGDVIVVPHGVPHWFKDVKGTFTYLVIKVPKQG
jgi:mannose-6-phosphate isomerase-like protein (cupin superfamily)